MEFLEASDLFTGRNYGIFHGAADDCGSGGGAVLSAGVCDDHFYYCKKADFRRSRIGLAVSGVHYFVFKRRPVLLYRDIGTISGENIYGGKEASDLPGKRRIINLNSFLTA